MFDSIRQQLLEIEAQFKIYLDCDKDGQFDYKKCTDKKYSSLKVYREAIIDAVQLFKVSV
jgi:hypothetical protein